MIFMIVFGQLFILFQTWWNNINIELNGIFNNTRIQGHL